MRIILVLIAAAIAAHAEDNLLVQSSRGFYSYTKVNILKAAEKMPEGEYKFQPTPETRTFGQILGHIADVNLSLCAAGAGVKASAPEYEKTKTTKADLIAALKQAFAACDDAYAGMTDAKAREPIKFLGGEKSRLSAFDFNVAHNYEHYGNLSTYMRLRGIVPPSSESGH
jgi:uncharacterized damage-inducible protein DinB